VKKDTKKVYSFHPKEATVAHEKQTVFDSEGEFEE